MAAFLSFLRPAPLRPEGHAPETLASLTFEIVGKLKKRGTASPSLYMLARCDND